MPAAPPTNELVGYLAKRLHHATRRHLDQMLRDLGLTTSQLALLVELEGGTGASPAELARRCQVRPQAMTKLLNGLEASGLITRAPNLKNAHTVSLRLTATGTETLRECSERARKLESRMLHGLAQDQQDQLRAWLKHCTRNLEATTMADQP